MFRKMLCAVVLMAIAASVVPQPAQAQSGVGIVDQVLAIVARNLGMSPSPTRGQLDLGNVNFPVDMGYTFSGLDLRNTSLSCTAPQIPDDTQIVGNVGYVVVVTVQTRRYEFRTNSTGSVVIRCSGGQEVNATFGAAPAVGATVSSDQLMNIVIQHMNAYLDLETPLTLQAINDRTLPYRASYSWNAQVFTSTSMGCPASGATYTQGDLFGYRVIMTVKGRTYRYYVRGDGRVVILCLGGRPDASSIGL